MASKEEWFHFIEEEEGEMFALDLIEDIIFNSQKVLFAKQVDKQILPYTVHFAEEAMNDMINVRFKETRRRDALFECLPCVYLCV